MMPSPSRTLLLACAAVALCAIPAQAHLSRFFIDRRWTLPARGGPQANIAYEVINGHFEGELDPGDAHNRIITDLALAPRDGAGLAGYSSNFTILKPVDMKQATGILYDMIPNRGHGEAWVPDPYGHVHVMTGWQGDIAPQPGMYTAQVPVAHNKDGSSITGLIFARFVDMPDRIPTLRIVGGLGAGVPRPLPVSLDTSRARLFYQTSDEGPQIPIPPGDWAFADCTSTPFPGRPDPGKISVKGGFSAMYSYGLVYTGKDPLVLGIGFAATRDLVSFLRYGRADAGGGANPLADEIQWAVTTGASQSGNYVRSFIDLGFNADEQGRIVFDGANPNIAARLVPLNVRFGLPGGAANRYELGSEGVLWWGDYTDQTRGLKRAGLLDRCIRSHTCPKIIETFGESEIWNLRMSPDLVGTDAGADIPLPANVRRYYFPGVTHGGANEGAAEGFTTRESRGNGYNGELARNPNPSAPLWRAAMVNLIRWVKEGVEPPPSSYPTLAHGDLVAPNAKAMGFPALPGGYTPDGKINPFVEQDAGAAFDAADLSGVTSIEPPRYIRDLPSLVPKVNADGNETCGIATVLERAPLGTYTGWNAYASGYNKGRYFLFNGGFIPFALTRAERIAKQDPRPSIQERYGTHDAYVARVRAAADQMVAQRLLLPADAARIVDAAEKSAVLR